MSAMMEGRPPKDLPSFYWRMTTASVMREMGYINCTPANVDEYDEYDLMTAMIMYDIQNDPEYKKVAKAAQERKSGARKGKRATRTTPTGNTIRRAK